MSASPAAMVPTGRILEGPVAATLLRLAAPMVLVVLMQAVINVTRRTST
jgi:hypothetical protein